jgi:dTDP-4-amino-4,6-dideoxygalactose transaminase
MIRFVAPAGHIIKWTEIIKALFNTKKETFIFEHLLSKDQVFVVNSGTSALYLLLLVLKRTTSKKEIIIPAYTCPTVAAAIIKADLEPVLCDINLNDFSLNTTELKEKINENTLAVIQVELFGLLPDNTIIREIANEKNILLIGDAAQSFGNYLLNKSLFTSQMYDYLIYSSGRGKPINLLHGGGIIILQQKNQADFFSNKWISNPTKPDKIKSIIDVILFKIFFHPYLFRIPQSLPFLKLGETIFTLDFELKFVCNWVNQLAKLIINRFTQIHRNRLSQIDIYYKIISKYSKSLIPLHFVNNLDLIRFPILFKEPSLRDIVLKELKRKGIGATGLYPYPLHLQPGLEQLNLKPCKNAIIAAQQILTLPVHEYLTEKDFKKTASIFKKYLE